MSLNAFPLKTVEVIDPVTRLNNPRVYQILRGGNEVSYQEHISTSFSNSSIQLSANPPSQATIIDRNCRVKTTWTLVFTEVGGPIAAPLLKLGTDDGLRCQPFSSVTQTITAKVNNDSVSTNINEYLTAFQRYANDDSVQDFFSTSPQMPDAYTATYDYSLYGSGRNPLAKYGENTAQQNRGGFVFDSITNVSGAGTATVVCTLVEPFYLSPFLFGGADESGLIGVSTLSFNWVLGNLQRLWTKSTNSTAYTMTATLNSASALFKYITPNLTSDLPAQISYPYNEILPLNNPAYSMTAGTTRDFQMSSYQLNSIPTRMYIYVRRDNSEITSLTSDTFLAINSVTIKYGNRTGLLSSASKQDLYYMSKRNGCNLTYPEWTKYVGSVLCVNFGTDIGLSPIQAPGVLENTQLSMTVNVTNQTGGTVLSVLYVVLVSEGTFSIANGSCMHQIGVVSREDVERVADATMLYTSSRNVYGGSFWGDVWSGIKDTGSFVAKNLPQIISTARDVKSLIGKGATGGTHRRKHTKTTRKGTKGAGLTGGRKVSRRKLRSRAH